MELACFPDVELELRMALRSLYRDGFDEPLATLEEGFAKFAKELVVELECAVVQLDKILNSECRDLFFAAATCVFSHLHLCEPGFDRGSVILPVPAEGHDHAAEAVKGLLEELVRRGNGEASHWPNGCGAREPPGLDAPLGLLQAGHAHNA
ncbi:hypothetical protein D1007_30643 [Hordeum vulgare]|nr:hypothetical protein D1007_30643 [Hordeum vulgare]